MLVNQSIQNGEIELEVEEEGDRESIDKYIIIPKCKKINPPIYYLSIHKQSDK